MQFLSDLSSILPTEALTASLSLSVYCRAPGGVSLGHQSSHILLLASLVEILVVGTTAGAQHGNAASLPGAGL